MSVADRDQFEQHAPMEAIRAALDQAYAQQRAAQDEIRWLTGVLVHRGAQIEAATDPPAPIARDQGILAQDIDRAANLVSGLGEHGLANQLWALAGRVRAAAQLGGRHVKDSTDAGYPRTTPGGAS